MDCMFTIPYPEYRVIQELSGYFSKAKGHSCFIPASRQEKDVDFVLRSFKTGKFLSFQVKASRAYSDEQEHTFWFSNFCSRYKPKAADYYILFGLQPKLNGARVATMSWSSMILCIGDNEMCKILNSIKTKKGKRDRFFYVKVSEDNEPIGTRGFPQKFSFAKYLLPKQVDRIQADLA